ncbi:kinase-like protein [Peniophora sp. CONT]|nr:kinase-like protein [Peniophora sp. CONT]
MSTAKSWLSRKKRLSTLLGSAAGDETEEGLALDRLLHGQAVIGKTSKTSEVESLRFGQDDLTLVGALEYGQYSVIDVVKCNHDSKVYVRKSIEKRFAYKTRDQCNPQLEKKILLKARELDSPWTPHLLCSFQTETHLNLVMSYAEGGTLWDVLESSPHDGRVREQDLMWWFPQIVAALEWCHKQGFVHRDVKPHNFVIASSAQLQLIDFGSAAPLLPPDSDGIRLVPREHCMVPCGTCDYIAPEILQAHEAALVAYEMTDEDLETSTDRAMASGARSYGVEVDWWSMGAMLYEMAFGAAPFFANDIRSTYQKIVDHKKSLRFRHGGELSAAMKDFIGRLLTDAEVRLGRHGSHEIRQHTVFQDIAWENLLERQPPHDLHLPIFAYNTSQGDANAPPIPEDVPALDHSGSTASESSHSQGFPFSAFFQSSSPALSALHPTPRPNKSIMREQVSTFFIGFSWGPRRDAFPAGISTPSPPQPQPAYQPGRSISGPPRLAQTPYRVVSAAATPSMRYPFVTPLRPSSAGYRGGMSTLPRTATIRRTVQRRAVSDREAMRQLVDCIGMSAQKKLLAVGRTPRTIGRTPRTGGTAKALRFVPAPIEIGLDSMRRPVAVGQETVSEDEGRSASIRSAWGAALDDEAATTSESEGESIPPSPSPSPRPGSAMSMLSRRSATPTMSTWSLRLPSGWPTRRSTSPSEVLPTPTVGSFRNFPPTRPRSGSEPLLSGPRIASTSSLAPLAPVAESTPRPPRTQSTRSTASFRSGNSPPRFVPSTRGTSSSSQASGTARSSVSRAPLSQSPVDIFSEDEDDFSSFAPPIESTPRPSRSLPATRPPSATRPPLRVSPHHPPRASSLSSIQNLEDRYESLMHELDILQRRFETARAPSSQGSVRSSSRTS